MGGGRQGGHPAPVPPDHFKRSHSGGGIMPKLKYFELPKGWISHIEFVFEIYRAKNIPVPKPVVIKKFLKHEGVGHAYKNLIWAGGDTKAFGAIVSAVAICLNWSPFCSPTKYFRIDRKKAQHRAAELRAAKECPLLNDDGRHHLEIAARYYDLEASPRKRGRRKETFVMALALELHDVFKRQIGKPVHAAIGGLVEAVFGGHYEQESPGALVKRARRDEYVKLWTAPPTAYGLKPIEIMRQLAIEKLTNKP